MPEPFVRRFAAFLRKMRLDARALRGVILLAFLLIAAGILLRHLAPQADTLTGWMDRYLPGGYVGGAVYVCSVAGLSCLAVPRQLLSFAGGYAFGALPGALLSTLGVTLGCVLAFGLSRYAGRSFVERRYGDKAEAFNRIVVKRPFVLALLIRLFPSGNNLVCSLIAGVSRIPALPFFLGSCLGYLPQNLLFSMLGSGMRVDAGWRIGLGVALFAASCLLAWGLASHSGLPRPLRERRD